MLPREKQLLVFSALVNGNSERGVERITIDNKKPVSRPAIGALALRLGTGAQWFHNARAFGLRTDDIEQDEMWSYVRKKQSRATPEENARGLGEAYTFVSLGMPSRFVIGWMVGRRDQETANAFEADTRAGETIRIDAAYVDRQLSGIAKDTDLSKYIL